VAPFFENVDRIRPCLHIYTKKPPVGGFHFLLFSGDAAYSHRAGNSAAQNFRIAPATRLRSAPAARIL